MPSKVGNLFLKAKCSWLKPDMARKELSWGTKNENGAQLIRLLCWVSTSRALTNETSTDFFFLFSLVIFFISQFLYRTYICKCVCVCVCLCVRQTVCVCIICIIAARTNNDWPGSALQLRHWFVLVLFLPKLLLSIHSILTVSVPVCVCEGQQHGWPDSPVASFFVLWLW